MHLMHFDVYTTPTRTAYMTSRDSGVHNFDTTQRAPLADTLTTAKETLLVTSSHRTTAPSACYLPSETPVLSQVQEEKKRWWEEQEDILTKINLCSKVTKYKWLYYIRPSCLLWHNHVLLWVSVSDQRNREIATDWESQQTSPPSPPQGKIKYSPLHHLPSDCFQ